MFILIYFFKATNLTENTIFVADTGNDRVAMFSESGNFIRYIGVQNTKSMYELFLWNWLPNFIKMIFFPPFLRLKSTG